MRRSSFLVILLVAVFSYIAFGLHTNAASTSGSLEEQVELVLSSPIGEQLLLGGLRRMSNRSLPLFVEYVLAEGAEGLEISWDLNQLEDSDWDGQFRNDQDAAGGQASYIYNTNRTPFVVTVTALTADGVTYVGQDEISFVIQAGDVVMLSPRDPRENAGTSEAFTWTSFPGDPSDANWAVNSADGTMCLAPEYPGICTVQASTADETITTDLFVFNPDPDLLQIRGMNHTRTGFEHISLEYIEMVYRELASRGFNWVNIPFTWMYSRTGQDYGIFAPEARDDQQHPTDEKLVAVTRIGHEVGLNVSWSLGLQESDETPNPISRWLIEGSDGFFEGDDGYTAFALHAADLAVDAKPEMLVAFVEMGALQMPSGRSYLESFYRELREALPVCTALTTSNLIVSGCDLPECRPEPYLGRYATPYGMLDSVGFSSWMPVASTCSGSLAAMQDMFARQQLEILRKVHTGPGASTDLFISEYGCPAFDCGAACFGLNGYPCPAQVVRDDEEQRRATAAALRAMYDFSAEGNEYFSGILWWEWMLNTDEGLASWNWADLNLNWRPALDEITAFFLDSPRELEQVPIFTPYKWWKVYFNPMQEVISERDLPQSSRPIQGFSSAAASGIEVDEYEPTGVLDASIQAEIHGSSGLVLDYENKVGRGGETLADVPVLPSWTQDDGLWIRVKRSTNRIGAALLLFDEQEHITYSLRLPLRESGEWEELGVLLESATKNLSSGDPCFCASSLHWLADDRMAVYLYSLDGSPVTGRVWVDEIRSFKSDP